MSLSTRRVVAAVAATASIALLSACASGTASQSGSDSADSGSSTIRMATQPWIGYGAWYVAEDQGYFGDNGITVEQSTFSNDSDLTASFVSGSVDVANVSTHAAMRLLQQGLDIKVIMIEDVSEKADAILAPKDVTSITDLAGKSVAYEQGSTSDLLLNYALQSEDMTLDDINAVPLNASDAGAALISGQVDAAVTYEPYITTALGEDSDLNLLYTAGEQPGLVSDVLIASTDYIDGHKKELTALVKSWGQGIDYYNENTDEARAVISEGVGEEPDALKTAFDGVKYYDGEENASDLGGDFKETTMPLVLKAAKAAKIIEGDPDLDKLVDTQFVE